MSKTKYPPFDQCRYFRNMITDLEMQIARDRNGLERGWDVVMTQNRIKAQEERLKQCQAALARAQRDMGQMPI